MSVEIHRNKRTVTVSDDEHRVPDSGPVGFVDGLKDLLRPAILKPLQLIVTLFFFFHAASLTAMRPYMIEVFARLEVPLSPNVLTVSGRLNDRFQCGRIRFESRAYLDNALGRTVNTQLFYWKK